MDGSRLVAVVLPGVPNAVAAHLTAHGSRKVLAGVLRAVREFELDDRVEGLTMALYNLLRHELRDAVDVPSLAGQRHPWVRLHSVGRLLYHGMVPCREKMIRPSARVRVGDPNVLYRIRYHINRILSNDIRPLVRTGWQQNPGRTSPHE